MNNNKARQIHTGLYTKVAKEIIDSVIGQLSDGWGEKNPSNEKWWRFATCVQAPDGEVLIEISAESSKYAYAHYDCRSNFTYNGFYSMSDDEVKQKFASWIKKTAKMEMADDKAGNQWKRDSVMELCYLNHEENVTVADAYLVYEMLIGRDNLHKYSPDTVLKTVGKKLSDEATKANEEKERQIAEKLAHRDQLLQQLADKKAEDIKKIEEQYNKDRADIVKQCQKQIDDIKAA